MRIEKLRLVNWRNYKEEELIFDSGVNVVCGDNAQGKTNLLEAVSYLGLASSFRGSPDGDLIKKGSDFFYVEARLFKETPVPASHTISSAMDIHRRRKLLIDGSPCRRLADSVGFCHNVVFSPDDIFLIKGSPEGRRRWLNRQLSQTDPIYCRDLIDYNKVLRQRNALLKTAAEQPCAELLLPWTQQLIDIGSRITCRRMEAINRLSPMAAQQHSLLAAGETLELTYISRLLPEEGEGDKEALIAENFTARLKKLEEVEYRRGMTLAGPHRDDVEIKVNGLCAREMASQGQQRTAAISMKLAELEWGRQEKGEYPVLLLDDVLSELDDKRRRRILQLPEKVQTIITAAGKIEGFSSAFLVESRDGQARIKKLK